MFRKQIAARPLVIWLLCAMTAPIVQVVAGNDPLFAVLLSAACVAVVCLGLAGNGQYGKILSGLQYLWAAIAAGVIAQAAGKSWPMGEAGYAVPLVLLALAAWSASKGPATAARTAGILFILLCVGYGLIFAAGLSQINGSWVTKLVREDPKFMVFLLLLPGTAACLPRQSLGKRGLWLFVLPAFCLLATVVTSGSVHPDAKVESFAFFEMCRSLSLFGFAERFEALACALLSVGWFSLLALLMCSAGAAAQNIFPGKGRQGVWLAAAAAGGMVLGKISIASKFLLILGAIFWGLAPILFQGIEWRKKSRKK